MEASPKARRVWLFSRSADLAWLFLPVWACWLVCFALPSSVLQREVPLWIWVVFVLGIDVSHVWSTIFRTYLDKEEFNNHKRLLVLTPILSFTLLFCIALLGHTWYWRVLAYLALYHFIKQQYGFMAIYKARYGLRIKKFFEDKKIIYLSMLYPVLFWHLHGDRQFYWFIEGDFLVADFWTSDLAAQIQYWLKTLGNSLYWAILIGWLAEEVWLSFRQEANFPIGKVLWVLTTAGNWYLGIVYFNSDLAFTLTNVIAHGLPYMALVFFYVERKKAISGEKVARKKIPLLQSIHVIAMLGIVLVLALSEEYLWDMLLYREKYPFFETLFSYPMEALNQGWAQAVALALLSIPQVAHYVIDGFIWKGGKKNPYLKKVLL